MNKKHHLLLLLFILTLISIRLKTNATSSKSCPKIRWGKLIVLGDSNTQFGFGESKWLGKIANLFQRKCDVFARGFSGYNSTSLKNMLPLVLDEFKYKQICGVLIMIGTNDSTDKNKNPIQHVSLNEYKTNIESILNRVVNDLGVSRNRTILISPPRIDDKHVEQVMGDRNTYSDNSVREYANVCKIVANEKKVLFLDLYTEMLKEGDKFKDMLSDGVHFSLIGGNFLYEKLEFYLNNYIGVNIEWKYPDWNDFKDDPSLLNFCVSEDDDDDDYYENSGFNFKYSFINTFICFIIITVSYLSY